ncbi:MAG: hypothetical protein EP330_17790 [Deltaproteobacteria bacterium]|nr:MAG: hypothetical protein EP330_17790 [Deltaproteobacteria bacterium]
MLRSEEGAILFWLTVAALAAPCDDPFTTAEFREVVGQADQALSDDDLVGFHGHFATIREQAACIEEAVDAKLWARFLFMHAVVQYQSKLEWRGPLSTALFADPTVERAVGITDLVEFPIPAVDTTHHVPVASDAIFLMDGVQVDKAPPGDLLGPHLVQSYAQGRWETYYIEDSPFPSHWLQPETPVETTEEPSRSKAPLAIGIGLAGAGAAAGVATWAMTRDRPQASPGEEAALKGVNVAGWALAGVGAGLVTLQVAKGVSVGMGPTGLVVRGGR